MTQKEKAKFYDEALERAKKELQTCGLVNCDAARQIFRLFPELKESEDELTWLTRYIEEEVFSLSMDIRDNEDRIKLKNLKKSLNWLEKQGRKDKLIQETFEKALTMNNKDDERLRKTTIAFLKDFADKGYENAVECISWLEKQNIFSKKDVDDAYLKGITDAKNEIEKQYEADYQIRKDIATFLFNYKGDIKDRAKWMNYLDIKVSFVEPKFKVGDWVIDKQNIVHQIANVIENVTDHTYGYDIVGGGYFNDNTEGVRLWTIQDAKDGDLLVCDINKAEIGGDVEKLPNIVSTIFIFKNVVSSRDYIHSYCHLYDRHVLGVQNTMYYNSFVYNIHPATKEQRDTLFQKMKEAGYEWNAEKKELKIIDWSKHKKYNSNAPSITKEWSEEDEKIRQTIINEFKQCSEWSCSNGLTKEDCINWLNKQEYLEWNDEDNENVNSLFVLLDQMVNINAIGNEHSVEYKNWLKSIKERIGGINCDTKR